MVVVGPEAPLAEGIVDQLHQAGIKCFGPTKQAAQLESSKAWSKQFMTECGIPTAAFQTFRSVEEAHTYIDSVSHKVVVKASGLAAGKGVIIPESKEEAKLAATSMLQDKLFGEAGSEIVVEEFLEGFEASFLAFSDGERLVAMPPAQDHKRLLDADKGPNTGGMGAFCPSPLISDTVKEEGMRHALFSVV